MRDSLLRYGLMVSLLLNFSFLGAAGYTHYSNTRNRPAPFGGGTTGVDNCGIGGRHLFEELGLGPEQRKTFEGKAAPFHAALAQKRLEVDRLRASLLALMRSDKPEGKSIGDTVARISGLQEEMQNTVVSHMLEFKSMLNSDQQKKFFDLVDRAMANRPEMPCP
ncbi:MAG: periplasmic heavy metal sensor [Thermodesulfobacteriota bacterium]